MHHHQQNGREMAALISVAEKRRRSAFRSGKKYIILHFHCVEINFIRLSFLFNQYINFLHLIGFFYRKVLVSTFFINILLIEHFYNSVAVNSHNNQLLQ